MAASDMPYECEFCQKTFSPDLGRIYIQGYYIPDIYPIQGYINDIYIQNKNVIYDRISYPKMYL